MNQLRHAVTRVLGIWGDSWLENQRIGGRHAVAFFVCLEVPTLLLATPVVFVKAAVFERMENL